MAQTDREVKAEGGLQFDVRCVEKKAGSNRRIDDFNGERRGNMECFSASEVNSPANAEIEELL